MMPRWAVPLFEGRSIWGVTFTTVCKRIALMLQIKVCSQESPCTSSCYGLKSHICISGIIPPISEIGEPGEWFSASVLRASFLLLFPGSLSTKATPTIVKDIKVFTEDVSAQRTGISVNLSGNSDFTSYSELNEVISVGSGFYCKRFKYLYLRNVELWQQ